MNLSSFAKKLGAKGGRVRAKKLRPEIRRQIASLGGKARTKSLKLSRRIAENFRYLEAVQALSPPPRIRRLKKVASPLPEGG